MYYEMLKKKLLEQDSVYQAMKAGNIETVKYMAHQDEKRGTSDANFRNRMRLSHYLLYAEIEDETAVVQLFREELKDRQTNSFQGIGRTLVVLNSIMNRYGYSSKYSTLLEEAKNANFDCFAGYDPQEQISSDIDELDLIECIFLARDLDFKDEMDVLVNEWRQSIVVWTDQQKKVLCEFLSILGKDGEKESIYKDLLANAVENGKIFDVVSAYDQLIHFYVAAEDFESAYLYLRRMIKTTDFSEVERLRLFQSVLEASLVIISGHVAEAMELWQWAKPYLQKMALGSWFGDLYSKAIAAASCVGDPYAMKLEKEYLQWKRKSLN
jgi:hypothetical protein